MAVAMPAIVLTSGFRGILEARNKFKIINIIRLPMGLLTFIGPLIVINFGFNRLDYITIFLAGGRVVACILHGWYAWNVLPVECRRFSIELKILPELCRSGGWLTVSNVISPLMSYMDRFIIGALLSASAVTYYTTPQELVTKLWIIPGALTAVLFPSFAAKIRMNNNDGWIMFCKSVRWLFFLMLPISLIVTFFSKKILTIWINNSFASESFILLSVFSFGVFVSCLAQIPFTVLQSAGRSNVTAKIHMIELPLFILTMWLLTKNYGVLGSACAWVFRISIDAVLMMFYAIKELKKPFSLVAKSYSMCVFVLGILSFLGGLLDSNKIKSCVIIFISCVSFLLLSKEIKNKI
jgi:O-antigen/teichoic acid export membrane protein